MKLFKLIKIKKLLLILICLFVSFELKSDILEDLNKSKNVSRLEYSLDKLIPELKLNVFVSGRGRYVFKDDINHRFSDKKCFGQIAKLDHRGYKENTDYILLGCKVDVEVEYKSNGKNISNEEENKRYNELLNEDVDMFAKIIAKEMFVVLGNYGSHIKHRVLISKFDSTYNTEFYDGSEITKKQKDFVNLLKERIVFYVKIGASGAGRTVEELFYSPFSQEFDITRKGLPIFEKQKVRGFDSKRYE